MADNLQFTSKLKKPLNLDGICILAEVDFFFF